MRTGRGAVVGGAVLVLAAATVAGCTTSSSGRGTPPTRATVTATDTVTSSRPGSTAATSPTAGTSSGATGGTSTGASGPGLCTPTVMTFRLGAGGGAAGTDYYPVIATNASQQPCVTTGYPGVAMLDAGGRQIAQAARVTSPAPVTTIVVQPGQQVSARLRTATTGDGGATCPTSPALLFTMPDNTDSTRIVTGLPACADGVAVGALVRGTTGMP